MGYVWCEICVGYVWCEIRQQSSEEPCDETSFGEKKKITVAQPPKNCPQKEISFGRENSSFLAVAVADLSGYLFKTAQRIASREIS